MRQKLYGFCLKALWPYESDGFDMANNIGVYLHIPFCKRKCAYCDFFSGHGDAAAFDRYEAQLLHSIDEWGAKAGETVTSVYVGGGTPSVLGDDRLCRLLHAVKQAFRVAADAEVTLEVNPESGKALDFCKLRAAGFNRVSVGLQSAIAREIAVLERLHTPQEAKETVQRARAAGVENISLDLMLGIPYQTKESLRRSVDFCVACGVRHLSCYLLKIEEGTRFFAMRDALPLPDEDAQAELYLEAVSYLEQHGLYQYEISNFAVPGFESRHNTHYWQCGEYIGIGPSAHSFYHGKRFYYPRDMRQFEAGTVMDDGTGGDAEEYILLALRLKAGLRFGDYEQRFGKRLSSAILQKISRYAKMGLMECDDRHAHFTPQGFLVSNTILADILL